MYKLDVIALANSFAIIDLILHPFFHVWVWLAPGSYELAINLFVAGLHLEVTRFDTSLRHILVGSIIEASAFWILGALVAAFYNKLSR